MDGDGRSINGTGATVLVQDPEGVRWLPPGDLREHPLAVTLYGREVGGELAASVREQGVQVPLRVRPDGTIVDGHRRWRAAVEAGLAAVPCVEVAFPNALEELQAILHYNRDRKKTGAMRHREYLMRNGVYSAVTRVATW